MKGVINKMKPVRWLLVILMILVAYVGWAQDPSVDVYCKDLSGLVAAEQHQFRQQAMFRANPRTSGYDVRYHRMEWSVDPAENYIAGKVTTYFVPTQEGLDTINFDLEDNMLINAVVYHGDSLTYSFTTTENLHNPASRTPGQLVKSIA